MNSSPSAIPLPRDDQALVGLACAGARCDRIVAAVQSRIAAETGHNEEKKPWKPR